MEAPLQRQAVKESTRKAVRRRSLLPLKIIDGYLLHYAIESTVRGLLWFAGLLLMFAVITAVRKVLESSIPIINMWELVIYQMPRIIAFTLPMSILFGTVQTFSDLSGRGEVTALHAGGMSLPRMVWAPLGWGAILAAIAFFLQEAVVPSAELKKDLVLKQKTEEALTAQGRFTFVDPPRGGPLKRIIHAEKFDAKTSTLIRPRIQIYNPDGSVQMELKAERGQWDFSSGDWTFYNAKTIVFPKEGSEFGSGGIESIFDRVQGRQQFNRDIAPSPGLMGQASSRERDALERQNFEMVSIIDLWQYRQTLYARLRASQRSAGQRPVRQSRQLRNVGKRFFLATDQEEIEKRIKGATFGLHDKIAT
ncbi:MAG: LptF/LptG family permease, partial [Armatimonadota bacterium]|nr:LptF/LptG family permease [Armatimonadota bacterium]